MWPLLSQKCFHIHTWAAESSFSTAGSHTVMAEQSYHLSDKHVPVNENAVAATDVAVRVFYFFYICGKLLSAVALKHLPEGCRWNGAESELTHSLMKWILFFRQLHRWAPCCNMNYVFYGLCWKACRGYNNLTHPFKKRNVVVMQKNPFHQPFMKHYLAAVTWC